MNLNLTEKTIETLLSRNITILKDSFVSSVTSKLIVSSVTITFPSLIVLI